MGCGTLLDEAPLFVLPFEQTLPAEVTRAQAAYQALVDFTANVDTWSVDGQGGVPDDGSAAACFKAPRKSRYDVTRAADPQKVGSAIVWLGSGKAEIRLAKPMPIVGRFVKLPLDDKRLCTQRGLRLDQMDMQAILERVARPGNTWRPVGPAEVAGRKAVLIAFQGSMRGVDKDVTEEVVGFDDETGLPILDEAYIGQDPVLKLVVHDLKINTGFGDQVFDLRKTLLRL